MSSQYENFFLNEITEEIRDEQSKKNVFGKIIYNRFVQFIGLFALCSFIGIGTPMIWNQIWHPRFDVTIESDLRYDCSPLRPVQKLKENNCNRKSCLWDDFTEENKIRCYYGMERDEDVQENLNLMPCYSVFNQTDAFNYVLKMKVKPPFIEDDHNNDLTKNPVIYHRLSLSVRYHTEKHFSVLIKPEHENEELWSKHFDFNYLDHNGSIESAGEISIRSDIVKDHFQLKVKRRSTGAKLFDMGLHSPFIFSNGHIEITTLLLNDLLYGLGQSNQPFKHNFSNPSQWNLFNQYHDNLGMNATNLFGSHPFYLGIDDPEIGNAYGVLLLNTFPIQAIINARPSLTLRTLGGHLELHYFLGPKPNEVIQQLQNFIHKPAMPPYWALGFHMCHTHCSLPKWSQTVAKVRAIPVPIESDCGSSLRVGDDKFNNFAKKLHDENMKWIAVTSPHLLSSSGKLADKWKKNVLLEYSNHNKPYSGIITGCDLTQNREAIPLDQTAFYPDFFNDNSHNLYIKDELNTNADGYILDMNTPIDLANGNHSCLEMLKRYKWNYYYFAYLNEKNPCLDSRFSDSKILSGENDNINQSMIIGPYLSLHNIYGLKHSQAVFKKFKKKRPFVMSLSTFIGSGRYGGHISTSINGTWDILRFNLKQMLDFSLFGIPMTGFPIGSYKSEKRSASGNNGNLMHQWYQLASMQPFMIAYSGLDQLDTPLMDSLKNTIRSTIQTRYQILPYLYTLFYKASTNGDLVAQPLFFQFPTNRYAYNIKDQYMLGPALMISPTLDMDKDYLNVYFPKGRWYNFYSGQIAWNANSGSTELSRVNINIHLRGGQMVMTQEAESTIEQTRVRKNFQLIGGYDQNKKAHGELYIDSGDDPVPVARFMKVFFKAEYNNITIITEQREDFCQAMKNRILKSYNTILESIKMYGVIDKPDFHRVEIYENNSQGELKSYGVVSGTKLIEYDDKFGVLNIKINLDLCKGTYIDKYTFKHQYFLNWTYTNW